MNLLQNSPDNRGMITLCYIRSLLYQVTVELHLLHLHKCYQAMPLEAISDDTDIDHDKVSTV